MAPMLLRYSADRRTMAWALAMPLVALAPFAWPSLATWLWPLSCYLALSAGVIAHNHNHCQTFKSKRLNSIFGQWLSIFYGYPTFAWVPTHNLNHHKFVNRAGDATITWRYTNRHNFPMAFAFPFIAAVFQSTPTNEYIRKARATKPALYREIIRQYDQEGVLATPVNSSYNELVIEAGRKSLLAGGREVVIDYAAPAGVKFREY